MSIDPYRATAVESLPRSLWPSAAYSTVLWLIGRAQRAIARGDVPAAHGALVEAQQVVNLLGVGLRHPGSAVSEQLSALNEYITGELGRANVEKDAARLQSLIQVVTPLREAWDAAGRQALQSGGRPVTGEG